VSGHRVSRREQERLLKKLGINLEEIQGVEEVRIATRERVLILKNPSVMKVNYPGQVVYQISGEETTEEVGGEQYTPSEEDVLLVAQQTGKGLDEAKKALITAKGDLAQAILLLKD